MCYNNFEKKLLVVLVLLILLFVLPFIVISKIK